MFEQEIELEKTTNTLVERYLPMCKHVNPWSFLYMDLELSFADFNDSILELIVTFHNKLRRKFDPQLSTKTVDLKLHLLSGELPHNIQKELQHSFELLYDVLSKAGLQLKSRPLNPQPLINPDSLPAPQSQNVQKSTDEQEALRQQLSEVQSKLTDAESLNDKQQKTIEAQQGSITQLQQKTNEDVSVISGLKDKVGNLQTENNVLIKENSQLKEENAELKSQQDQSIDIDKLINKDEDPQRYALVQSLMELDEDEREARLEQVYQEIIPEHNGVSINGKCLPFLEKHWRLWIDLGWAIKRDVRKRHGRKFVQQVDREIERDEKDPHKTFPSQISVSQEIIRLTDKKTKNAVLAEQRTMSNKRKKARV